jgi:hypothetical protein
MSTCKRLDLQTLGSQPVMPKNLPDHCTTVDVHDFIRRITDRFRIICGIYPTLLKGKTPLKYHHLSSHQLDSGTTRMKSADYAQKSSPDTGSNV